MTARAGGRRESDGRGWAAVLFDLDGTLADTVPLILRCYRHTMRTHLGRELGDDRWLRTIGTPLAEQLRAFARDDDEHAAMIETYASFQTLHHDGMVAAYPRARDVAERLDRAGAALAVVTSKRRQMALRTLESCGLAELFPVVVGCDDVSQAKPHPEPVLRALAELGLEGRPGDVLFVGDSPYDVRSGLGAGVRTAGALWGPFARADLEAVGPHHLVECLDDVPRLRPVPGGEAEGTARST